MTRTRTARRSLARLPRFPGVWGYFSPSDTRGERVERDLVRGMLIDLLGDILGIVEVERVAAEALKLEQAKRIRVPKGRRKPAAYALSGRAQLRAQRVKVRVGVRAHGSTMPEAYDQRREASRSSTVRVANGQTENLVADRAGRRRA